MSFEFEKTATPGIRMGQPAERVKPWAKALGRGLMCGGRRSRASRRVKAAEHAHIPGGDGKAGRIGGPDLIQDTKTKAVYPNAPAEEQSSRARVRSAPRIAPPSDQIQKSFPFRGPIGSRGQRSRSPDRKRRRSGSKMTRLLNAEQVAERLQVPRSWVYAEARAGRIPHVKIGRYRRFREDAIENWVQAIERGPVRDRDRQGPAGG